MDGERVTTRNRNKAVFTVRPVWVTNGCRSAAAAAAAVAAAAALLALLGVLFFF